MSSLVVSGDTSGSVTIAAPAVAGSGTLTLPVATDTLVGKATTDTLTNKSIAATQLTGTVAVANGGTGLTALGPAFRANRSTTFNPSASTWTKVPLNSENFDTNNNFDSTTNYRFTPTVAGYYQLNVHGVVTGNPSECYVALYKNGGDVAQNVFIGTINQWAGMVSDIWDANGSTDYFEMYVNITSGSPACSSLYMSGSMARSA